MIREDRNNEQRTRTPNARDSILLGELRVEQDGCPAILLNMQLLAEHLDAASVALANPGLGFAFLHLGDLSGLQAMG